MTRKTASILLLLFTSLQLFSQQSTASKQVSIFTIEVPQLKMSKILWE